jgi:hypothetical protein
MESTSYIVHNDLHDATAADAISPISADMVSTRNASDFAGCRWSLKDLPHYVVEVDDIVCVRRLTTVPEHGPIISIRCT